MKESSIIDFVLIILRPYWARGIMLKLFLFVLLCTLRAGRSVWYDRHVGIVEAAGSNPAQSIRAARRWRTLPRPSQFSR